VRICALSELVDGAATRFVVDGAPVAVVRLGDAVYAIGDRCSHADVSLSDGDVDPARCQLECIKHGSAFDLRTGVPSTLPATKAVPVYHVRLDAGDVFVEQP
jgi:3-phenylpropionate/trans-cinnamate dioxygenase ferredoxin subunit